MPTRCWIPRKTTTSLAAEDAEFAETAFDLSSRAERGICSFSARGRTADPSLRRDDNCERVARANGMGGDSRRGFAVEFGGGARRSFWRKFAAGVGGLAFAVFWVVQGGVAVVEDVPLGDGG